MFALLCVVQLCFACSGSGSGSGDVELKYMFTMLDVNNELTRYHLSKIRKTTILPRCLGFPSDFFVAYLISDIRIRNS